MLAYLRLRTPTNFSKKHYNSLDVGIVRDRWHTVYESVVPPYIQTTYRRRPLRKRKKTLSSFTLFHYLSTLIFCSYILTSRLRSHPGFTLLSSCRHHHYSLKHNYHSFLPAASRRKKYLCAGYTLSGKIQ